MAAVVTGQARFIANLESDMHYLLHAYNGKVNLASLGGYINSLSESYSLSCMIFSSVYPLCLSP